MKLISIQVGKPRVLGMTGAADLDDREWSTGFYKEPIAGSVLVSRTNLAGDGQADLKNHGGPDKAICVYPQDHWPAWVAELGIKQTPGGFGENFTIAGAVEKDVCIGDVFRCQGVLVQVSQPRQPCWKLARRWRIKDLAVRVERTGRTGWYFRVLEEGPVEAGADFALLERPHPQWTVASANEVMHHRKTDWEAASRLAQCPALSESWRSSLGRRATTQQIASTAPRLEGK
jgi:MOSC domain-containing protein YiiM